MIRFIPRVFSVALLGLCGGIGGGGVAFGEMASGRFTAGGDGFLSGVEDVPLMAGLQEVTEENLVFDVPEGRIVQAEARGTVRVEAVQEFYEETLVNLGWQLEGVGVKEMVFRRGGEQLAIKFSALDGEAQGKETVINFSLIPAP
ncbi:MAG: hypothetical protein V6Z81_00055 [Parvularculales bacterium]